MTVELLTDFGGIAGVKCRHDDGDPDGAHPIGCDCQGTGYRYHWLWRECPGLDIGGRRIDAGGELSDHRPLMIHGVDCCGYDAKTNTSPGYVLIEGDRTDGLLRVARAQRWHVTSWSDGRVSVLDGATELATEDTLTSALVKALEVT